MAPFPRTARRHGIIVILLSALALAGCEQFPELDRKVEPAVMAGPYPALLPFEALVPPPPPPPAVVPDLTAQGAALQAMADAQNSLP